MAERRMFAKAIIDSDAFIDMPVTARLLYYDLGMRADDDGFVNSPKKIMRMVGASDDDMRVLISKKFIIPFESGVVVIKHWRIHNYIRKDRYVETTYLEEMSQLELDNKGNYHLVDQMATNGIPMVDVGKDSIGKDSIGNTNKGATKRFIKPTLDELERYIRENNLNVNAEQFYDYYESNGWKVGRNSMKDWKATVRGWDKRENDKIRDIKKKEGRTPSGNGYEICEEARGNDGGLEGIFNL